MARNIIYADSEAYQLGYKDGHKDGFYDGQQMYDEEAYKHAVEKACKAYCDVCDTKECEEWGGECECSWLKKFRKAMNYE